ncbi:MAG: hypothetical protein DA405_03375 [Bacteroidetes bacterium]|nr:MAG: hypothetical protein DA405_03375 [Bacteroidota bacterium]
MRFNLSIFFIAFWSLNLSAQELVDGRWVDDNLQFIVLEQYLKDKGEIYICLSDSAGEVCIENLVSGYELKVFDAQNKLLWEGFASGRRKGVKLPQAYPQARYVALKAFKPWVVNRRTGNKIHQAKAIELKYTLP